MTSLRLTVAAVALALIGCAAPIKLTASWVNPDVAQGSTKFQKIAVVAVTKDPANREAAENALAELVSSAHPSYKLIPTQELSDGGKVAEKLKGEGFDGLVVMSVVGYDPSALQAQEVAGSTASKVQYTPQTATAAQLRVESQVFSLIDDRLVWSGLSTNFEPESLQKTVKDIAAVVVEELKRRKVL